MQTASTLYKKLSRHIVNKRRRSIKLKMWSYYNVSKNAPTLASCSSDKHGSILLIFGKQRQHTFRNVMHIQLSLSLHFYLFYLLLNNCGGKDTKVTKQRVFLGTLLVALKRAGCVVKSAGFSLADVQSDVLLPSHMHITAFSIDQQLRRFVICLICHFDALHQVAAVADGHCVLYNVHTFLQQSPHSVVNRVSGSTGMFGGHRSGEIKSGVSC